MKYHFVLCSTPSFMNRTQVAIDSIKKYHPSANVVLTMMEDSKSGGYIPGLARKRIESVRDTLLQIERYNESVVMVGADCVFYSPLEVFDIDKVMLFSHVLTLPDKNVKQLYRTGHANADIVIFKKDSLDIVEWLLKQDLDDNLTNGAFYEQTYLSSLPFIDGGVSINRNPDINLAYFNIHERNLIKKNDKYYIKNENPSRKYEFDYPLTMVQFSGFIENYPEHMSKYHGGEKATGLWLELLEDYNRKIKNGS